jgi:hypothetical protein
VGSISLNPMVTTGVSGAFLISTDGYVQGTFLDDPAQRNQLEGGQVASSQSTPLWGGLAVALALPAVVGQNAQGPSVTAAGSLGAIAGWTLFNQASAGIITPSSNVPLYSSGMSVNFARPGSLLRICVAVENTTVLNALTSAAPGVSLYWDPVNLCITNSASGNYGPLPVQLEALSATSKTVTYSAGNANWNDAGPAAIIRI